MNRDLRLVRRFGIRQGTGWFWADFLLPLVGRSVKIVARLKDKKADVFTKDGEFVGTAPFVCAGTQHYRYRHRDA